MIVRRVRADEWRAVRDFRYEAVNDPAAAIAFLETPDTLDRRDDDFWRDRTTRAADSDQAAQFVAVDDQTWVGSLTVLIRGTERVDHLGRPVESPRADVVGVYVQPAHRGRGIVDALLAAAIEWAAEGGVQVVTLDVHTDNVRAQSAYRRVGFRPTGVVTDGPTGRELQYAIDVTSHRADPRAHPG